MTDSVKSTEKGEKIFWKIIMIYGKTGYFSCFMELENYFSYRS